MRKLLTLMWLFPAAAFADVIAPDEAECDGKARGAACSGGTCQDAECCRNDYSQGVPPRSVCSPCLRCKGGAPPPPSEPPPPPSQQRQFAPPPPGSAAPAPGSAAPAPGTTAPPTKTGCLAAPGAPGGLGLGALLGGGLLAFGLARSRRRR